MTLRELAEKYHSDKLHWHSYMNDSMYPKLFSELKSPVLKLLEIGIGEAGLMKPFLPPGVDYIHGSSLKLFREFFSEAYIYGVDIRQDVLFDEDRISTMWCDAKDPFSLGAVSGAFGPRFDIIIDDASHDYEQQHITASYLIPTAKQLYVIEDVFADKGELLASAFGGELWRGEKGRDDNLVIFRK